MDQATILDFAAHGSFPYFWVIRVVPAVFAEKVVTFILNAIHVVPSVVAAQVVPLLFFDRLVVFDR